MKKPPYVSHYLVLKDLIDGIDVRIYNSRIKYYVGRIENIKLEFSDNGLIFEDERVPTKYSNYKPYVLIGNKENIQRAKELLDRYTTKQVLDFLSVV